MIYGIAVLTQIVFYLIPVQIPFYLQALTNATASQSGLAIALLQQSESRSEFDTLSGLAN
jgi:hypothetical protein